jgi:hypothetical protein
MNITSEQIRDFWNTHFVDENENPKEVHFNVSIEIVGDSTQSMVRTIGGRIVLPGIHLLGLHESEEAFYNTMRLMFESVHEYLKKNGPLQIADHHVPAPGAIAPKAEPSEIISFDELEHNRKKYFVEQHKDGSIVIQDDRSKLILPDDKLYSTLLKKIEKLKN